MALVDKLAGIDLGPNDEKLPVHTFWAALAEFANGEVTKAQIVSYFNLDAGEESELDWLITRYNAQPDAAAKERFVELIHIIFLLAEGRTPGYTTNAQLVARFNAI